MRPPPPADLLAELVHRGLIGGSPPQTLGGGNPDRRPDGRTRWRVELPDGSAGCLTLGPDLRAAHERHVAFHRRCPQHVPAPRFHVALADGVEAAAEGFLTGTPLEATNPADETVAGAFAELVGELDSTLRASTEADRRAEWDRLTAGLLASPAWTEPERATLATLLLPRLYPLLTVDPPALRWTNGDFTSRNILVGSDGRPRLIDLEFAACTHFFREDHVRFHVLSPIARRAPAPFAAALPPVGPAWHLWFWLRQLHLESTHNSAAYLARVRPPRLALIRLLAEFLLDVTLPDWPAAPTPLHRQLESARWMGDPHGRVAFAGWSHAPGATLAAVVAGSGDRWLAQAAPQPRPDVQAHFAGAASALSSGFELPVAVAADPDAPLWLAALTADGELLPFHRAQAGDLPGRGPAFGDYAAWAARYDPDPPPPAKPSPEIRFSILLPVYRPAGEFLRACLESVRRQHHPHWELIIVDDGSGSTEVSAILQEFAAADLRVRLAPRATNGGIARATNDALALATAEFVLLLDHDDVLRPHALAELATALAADPTLDAVYADEDKITADGRRVLPFLKPAYSPEFLLGVMYVGHPLAVRTAVARAAGGFDPGFDGVQDYEFFLRVTERTARIAHVPRILYHWRQSAASSALHGNVKGDMDVRQLAAVRAHLARKADPRNAEALGGHRVRLRAPAAPAFAVAEIAGPDVRPADLRAAAAGQTAEVLVFVSGVVRLEGIDFGLLAALAGRPDSGLVSPVLLACEGAVLSAGATAAGVDVMRGFDPGGDGYNGSLRCDREVDRPSALCFAVRRDALLASLAADWAELCTDLRERGGYHRVCAAVQVSTTLSWRPARIPAPEPTQPASADPAPNRFLNPHFDPGRADYRLATPPAHHSGSSFPATIAGARLRTISPDDRR